MEYDAYCLDEALAYLYNGIQGQLDGVKSKNPKQLAWKRQALLSRILAIPAPEGKMFQTPTPTKEVKNS